MQGPWLPGLALDLAFGKAVWKGVAKRRKPGKGGGSGGRGSARGGGGGSDFVWSAHGDVGRSESFHH